MEAKYCTSDTDQYKHIENMKFLKNSRYESNKKDPATRKKNFILTPARWQDGKQKL